MVVSTFCLYLPDRLQRAVEQIEAQKIACRYIQGDDARTAKLPEIPNMMPGEVACAKGHWAIMNEFLDHTCSDWAVVLEDDVLLEDDPEVVLRANLHQVPFADVIVMTDPREFRDGYGPMDPDGDISYVKYTSWGTACYAISRRGAEIYRRELDGFTLKADAVWREPNKVGMTAAQLHPDSAIAVQDRSMPSVIEEAGSRAK